MAPKALPFDGILETDQENRPIGSARFEFWNSGRERDTVDIVGIGFE